MQGYIKKFSLNNLNINDITNFIPSGGANS